MADATPSEAGNINADSSRAKKAAIDKGKPRVKDVTSRAELKPDPESKFKVLQEGTPDNPEYKKYQLPDGTIKEVR